MKQTQSLNIHLRQTQSLQMTPQLQQAIKLLTLSAQEILEEIQKAVEENPLLEAADEDFDRVADTPIANAQQELAAPMADDSGGDADYGSNDYGSSDEGDRYSNASNDLEAGRGDVSDTFGDTHDGNHDDAALGAETRDLDDDRQDALQRDDLQDMQGEEQWHEEIPDELPVDSSWEDIYASNGAGLAAPEEHDDRDYEHRAPNDENLQEHLLWQLNLTRLSERDRLIGHAIIDAIDDDGFLSVSLDDVHAGLDADLLIEEDEVQAILHLIQQFDPVGIAARDLRECLLLQLRQCPADMALRAEAIDIVTNHLELLAGRNAVQLARRMHMDETGLKGVVAVIRGLNPRPGSVFNASKIEYITPDIIVTRERGRWVVELNPEIAPRLRISPDYAAMIPRGRAKAPDAATGHYLRDKLQEARWFINGLRHRSATLLRVAGKIVELQRGFFEHGPESLKPLVLRDVAEAIGVHESTISRVTTRKYMHTPRGVYELKYFFAAHVSTTSGESVANKVIQEKIKKLCSAEDEKHPLSDAQIVVLLKNDGYQVARRTVAKYRDALGIPSSNERRRAM